MIQLDCQEGRDDESKVRDVYLRGISAPQLLRCASFHDNFAKELNVALTLLAHCGSAAKVLLSDVLRCSHGETEGLRDSFPQPV